MSIVQIAAPDLSLVSLGGATLHLLEGLGFSDDGKTLLVRATFTDDADATGQLHYGVWTYDLVAQQYTSCLNVLLANSGVSAKDLDIESAAVLGSGSQLTILAETVLRGGTGESGLALIRNGSVDNNVLATVLGDDIQPRIERYALSNDGRFLALQTDSPLLAPVDSPDTNDSSDIYLLDLLMHRVERVSFVGGSEVTAPVRLGNVIAQDGKVQVAFSSDAAFTANDRNALSTAPTDAYLWSSAYDAMGLTGAATFSLASLANNQASGSGNDNGSRRVLQ